MTFGCPGYAPSLALLAVAGLLGACGKANPSASTSKHSRRRLERRPGPRPGARAGCQPDGGRGPRVLGLGARRRNTNRRPNVGSKRSSAQCVHPITATPLAEAELSGVQARSRNRQRERAVRSHRGREREPWRRGNWRKARTSRHAQLRLALHPVCSCTCRRITGRASARSLARAADPVGAGRRRQLRVADLGAGQRARDHARAVLRHLRLRLGRQRGHAVRQHVPVPPPAEVEKHLFSLLLQKAKAAENGHVPGGRAWSGPNPNITSS